MAIHRVSGAQKISTVATSEIVLVACSKMLFPPRRRNYYKPRTCTIVESSLTLIVIQFSTMLQKEFLPEICAFPGLIDEATDADIEF